MTDRVLRYSRRRKETTPEERLRRATAAILILGFAAAIIIYFTASPVPENPLGYDPLQNKAYRHELEVFGGRANVLAAEFRDWFAGLWHGKTLAYTVAVLTALAAYGFRLGVHLKWASAETPEETPGS